MAGDRDDLEIGFAGAEMHRLAALQRPGDTGDRLRRRTENLGPMVCQQAGNATLMIGMVMGHENARQRQPLAAEQFEHRAGVAGINHGGGCALAQQPDVVILEGWNTDDVEHWWILEELHKMSIPGLDVWLQSPQGRYVMAWEQANIDAVVADLFGYHAIQLGLPQFDLLLQNRIPLRQLVGESGNVDVRCDLRRLPFAAHSVDLVVMAHALEFHDDPHQILHEVARILMPEGELIITGFNPLSLWGLRQRLPNCPDDCPWSGHYLSVPRLRDWLQLLDFEVERPSFGCYAPPCVHQRWLQRWHFIEAAGDRWWTFAGGVYLLRAIKRVHGMRLILPSWKQQRSSRKALSVVSKKEII